MVGFVQVGGAQGSFVALPEKACSPRKVYSGENCTRVTRVATSYGGTWILGSFWMVDKQGGVCRGRPQWIWVHSEELVVEWVAVVNGMSVV